MNKTTVETQSTVKGLITVETTKDERDVDLYIREVVNCSVTAEASIRVSPNGFYDLVVPILRDLGCDVHAPAGGL